MATCVTIWLHKFLLGTIPRADYETVKHTIIILDVKLRCQVKLLILLLIPG